MSPADRCAGFRVFGGKLMSDRYLTGTITITGPDGETLHSITLEEDLTEGYGFALAGLLHELELSCELSAGAQDRINDGLEGWAVTAH